MEIPQNLPDVSTRLSRINLAENLVVFMAIYLSHYLKIPSAPFHYQLADDLTDKNIPLLEVIGFRDSAKSTYATTALVLWSLLLEKSKFIVVINDTAPNSLITMQNIKHELDTNPLIKADFRVQMGHTWSERNLVLSNGVRILGRSRGQSIRGIRHRESRPDLIIVDDPENLSLVRQKENRDKTEMWFNGEIIPAQQTFNSKLVVIGNFLHNDGFIARLSRNSLFKVVRIPVVDSFGEPTWKAKYPTKEHLERQRKMVGETAWAREYMLKVIAEDDQVIKETDIKYYPNAVLTESTDNGDRKLKIQEAGVGVDLAISLKETADFTAMVSGYKVKYLDKNRILVLPHPFKKRVDFDATVDQALTIKRELPDGTRFFVEDVGYQKSAIQTLHKRGVPTQPMRPVSDKRARLQAIAPYVKDGTVMFPENGCEELIGSIINMGVEEHDDDVDAFVYMVMGLINKSQPIAVERIDRI